MKKEFKWLKPEHLFGEVISCMCNEKWVKEELVFTKELKGHTNEEKLFATYNALASCILLKYNDLDITNFLDFLYELAKKNYFGKLSNAQIAVFEGVYESLVEEEIENV